METLRQGDPADGRQSQDQTPAGLASETVPSTGNVYSSGVSHERIQECLVAQCRAKIQNSRDTNSSFFKGGQDNVVTKRA